MFYVKLAYSNLKKSTNIFRSFLLTSSVLFMLNTSILLIWLSPVGKNMSFGALTLGLSFVVLFIFSVIMAIYSYHFLLKQRSREFGLYNILGMNKRQISLIATTELFIMFLSVVILGSLLSAAFSQLLYLIFINLLHYHQLVMTLSPMAFIYTAIAFMAIFLCLEVINCYHIYRSSPIMLFKKQEQGEKEPRGNAVLAMISLICLGVGYYLSLSSTKIAAIVVLYRFFIAVIFVIIGTYLFYISFMTWYLKHKRQNKTYFYQPEHFVTTSQMIFRMKQHAVGLANITLLATMTFVAIATTTSLYVDTQSKAHDIFPKNTQIEVFATNQTEAEQLFKANIVDPLNHSKRDYLTYNTLFTEFPVATNTKHITLTEQTIKNPDINKMGYLYIITREDFNHFGNNLPTLAENQTAFYTQKGNSKLETITLFGKKFQNTTNLKQVAFPNIVSIYNTALLIVSNKAVFEQVQERFSKYSPQTDNHFTGYANLSKTELKRLSKQDALSKENPSITITTRTEFLETMYGFTGSFLFTGFLIGISFLLGATLIIYHKQQSEGIEDRKSYRILQEIGMKAKDVKRSINAQILLLFFMPLGFATLHFAVSLVMLK